MEEKWKSIVDFPNYWISNYGKIISFKRNKNGTILKNKKYKKHYYVRLYKNNKSFKKYIHILVYENFHDYKLKKNECIHHVDQDPENNYVDNLKLMTKSKHHSLHNSGINNPMFGKNHSQKTLKKLSNLNKGEKNKQSKLTENLVLEIKRLLNENNLTHKEISKLFNVHRTTISYINNGKLWKHIKLEGG